MAVKAEVLNQLRKVLWSLVSVAIPAAVVSVAIILAMHYTVPERDLQTAVYTDRETGAQYLMSTAGGITPRLGADGRVVVVAKP